MKTKKRTKHPLICMNKNTINLSFLQTIRRIVCPQGYVLKNVLHLGSSLCFQLHSKYKRRPCPICGTMSSGRHGTYIRTLQDMPLCGYPVTLEFTLYKYYLKHHPANGRYFQNAYLPFLSIVATHPGWMNISGMFPAALLLWIPPGFFSRKVSDVVLPLV